MEKLRIFLQVLVFFMITVQVIAGDVCGNNKIAVNQVQAPNNASGVLFISTPYKDSTCIWQITAPVGYVAVARIYGLFFKNNDCESENLKIYDGTSNADKEIVKYCMSKKMSTGTEVWFSGVSGRLELKQGNTDDGPRLMVNAIAEKKPSCNDKMLSATSKESMLTSPEYGKGIPPGLFCKWTIEAPPDKHVKLMFNDLNIYICNEELEVFDGEQNSPDDLLYTRCSLNNNDMWLDVNKPVFSYGQKLLLVLKTKQYFRKSIFKGYKAVYSAVDAGKECGPGIANIDNIPITTDKGSLTSPGFPVSVKSDTFTCIWRAKAPKGQVIKVDLDSVNLREGLFAGLSCGTSLKFKTNIGPSRYKIEDLQCGAPPFKSIVSEGRRIEIIYEQKKVSSRRKPNGFNLKYSSHPLSRIGSCKANSQSTVVLQGDAATISTPNYPLFTYTNMTCRWEITVSASQVIEIIFTVYQLDSDCNSQFVRVYDGPSTSSPLLIKLCRSNSGTFFSSTNRLVVEFITKDNTKSRGFYFTYATREEKPKSYACSKDRWPDNINAESGQIASTRFPLKYPNFALCYQKIKLPKNNYMINLTFTSFDLEGSDDDKCSKDYVRLYSMDYTLANLCGKKKTPFSVLSKDSEMEVRFKSDVNGRYPGYEATFTAVQDLSYGNCTDQGKENIIPLTESNGVISSPRYPNYFPPNMHCTWKIQPSKDKSIRLVFDDVWLKGCQESSIVIKDLQSQKVLDKLCEYPTTPYVVMSLAGDGLQVEFKTSTFSFGNKGFKARYETISQLPLSISCRQDSLRNKLEGPGSIASYDFPLKYENDVKCTWVISTSDSNRFKIVFDFMDIEPSPGCKDDYVQIRDGGFSFSDSLGKFCGSTKPEPFKSSDSSIYVEFKTNGTGRYGGFKLSYEETYNTRTIVLIAVFSAIGGLALIGLIGYCVIKLCCGNEPGGQQFEQVGLKPTDE